MINKLKRFVKKEKGQGLVEYGLILALISVLSIGAVATLGEIVKGTFDDIRYAMIVKPPLDDEGYEWVIGTDGSNGWDPTWGYKSTNPYHRGIGYYRYTGDKTEVSIPHTIYGHEMHSYFRLFDGTNVEKVTNNNPRITDMSYMFYGSQAETLDVSELDTSKAEDMRWMFAHTMADTLDLKTFDTRNVEDMSFMFRESAATVIDTSSFNTSKVSNFHDMYKDANVEALDLRNFNTKNATMMRSMFHGSNAKSIDVSSFDTSNVEFMHGMFQDTKTETLDLSSFNTGKVTEMYAMFQKAEAKSINLSSFDTHNVTRLDRMFDGAQVEELDLSSFELHEDVKLTSMFRDVVATTGFAKDQASADLFNLSTLKPEGLIFTVKP